MVLAVVQHLLPLHPFGHPCGHVVRNPEEVDDLPQDHGGVRLRLERPQIMVGTYAWPSGVS